MAQPIKYQPVAETRESAREQLNELLEALAESGTLRLLKDFTERIGQVAQVLTERLETQPGRNALGNLALLGAALTELPPTELQGVWGAALRGLHRAHACARRRPPGLLHLMFLLRGENVRSVLFAALVLLDTLGESFQAATRAAALARNSGGPGRVPAD